MENIPQQSQSNWKEISCKYNTCIKCTPYKQPCNACGWNPEVSNARIEQVRKKIAAKCAQAAAPCCCVCSIHNETLDETPMA